LSGFFDRTEVPQLQEATWFVAFKDSNPHVTWIDCRALGDLQIINTTARAQDITLADESFVLRREHETYGDQFLESDVVPFFDIERRTFIWMRLPLQEVVVNSQSNVFVQFLARGNEIEVGRDALSLEGSRHELGDIALKDTSLSLPDINRSMDSRVHDYSLDDDIRYLH
jgi:hypothetical protein